MAPKNKHINYYKHRVYESKIKVTCYINLIALKEFWGKYQASFYLGTTHIIKESEVLNLYNTDRN